MQRSEEPMHSLYVYVVVTCVCCILFLLLQQPLVEDNGSVDRFTPPKVYVVHGHAADREVQFQFRMACVCQAPLEQSSTPLGQRESAQERERMVEESKLRH